MVDVLILSKTHMYNDKCCVGGITSSGRYVRLLNTNEENQPETTEFQPRQVWKIDFIERKLAIPPHIEDVLIISKHFKGKLEKGIKVKDFIEERKIVIWRGNPDNLFDGLVKWTANGSGYIDTEGGIPGHSVGFWICDKDLTRREFNGVRYSYPSSDAWRGLKFKGFEDPVKIIPHGTLIRVSLARWKSFDPGETPKCWLQLSGWYDYDEK